MVMVRTTAHLVGGDGALDKDSSESCGWKDFLTAYAQGEFSPLNTPVQPLSPTKEFPLPLDNIIPLPSALYASTTITDDTARNVETYHRVNDYLPPPRSPHEGLRETILLEYDILGPVQTGNIQSAVDILAAFFPTAIVTFTLFNNCIQTFFALSGPPALIKRYGLETNAIIQSSNSLCGHSVLLEDKVMFVPRMDTDWRFRSNPYVLAGILSYIGSPVSLQCDPLDASPVPGRPSSLGIGALNIMFVDEPHVVLTEKEKMVVENVTRMLIAQLRATWEGHIRTREARARKAVADMIQETFMSHKSAGMSRRSSSVMSTAGNLSTSMSSEDDEAGVDFRVLAASAMDKLVAVTDIDGVAMLDVRGLCIKPHSLPAEYTVDTVSPRPLTIIASTPGTISDLDPVSLVSYLNSKSLTTTFHPPTSLSDLEPLLPCDTQSHFILPFFSLRQPIFIIIGITRRTLISDSTINLARSLGSILLAKSIQSRVLEADAAKTAFLSSISHELRTPLYGVLSGLELAQKTLKEGDTEEAGSVLDVARVSGLALGHILNDVLDFGRGEAKRNGVGVQGAVKPVLLEEVVRDAANICLAQFSGNIEAPEVVLVCEQRRVQLDQAKYHRILINGLTNALKFCSKGTITISVSWKETLVTRIVDTGIGFDEASLPHLLEPFTKHDSHSPGAGLGLYITKQLAIGMRGTLSLRSKLGKGTTFEVVLPVSAGKKEGVVRETIQPARLAITVPVPAKVPRPNLDRGTTRLDAANALRVLIVDDNAICLKILHTALKRGSTRLTCAQAIDGEKAVEKFKDFNPHLVLTDVSMPIMDGVAASREMRVIAEEKGWGRCKIYALTGLGSSDPRLKQAGMAGAGPGSAALDGWLVKGLDGMEVIHSLVAEAEEERLRAMEHCEVEIE